MLTRRSALQRLSGSLALAATAGLPRVNGAEPEKGEYQARNTRIQQSVIHWCFKPMPVEELAAHAARMGLKSVELVAPEYWPALKKLGLVCAITPSHGFAKGFAHVEEHEECLKILRQRIDDSAAAGFPNV